MNNELDEKYKFVYRISCEPRMSGKNNCTTIAQKIIGTRIKMFNNMTIDLLKQIAEEKGYSDLLIVDEEKVANMIKAVKVLELIKNKGIMLRIPENEYSKEHFDIHIYTNTMDFEEMSLFEEIML